MVKSSGGIRLIDTAKQSTCKSTEQEVTWNQAGQPGEDGTDITVDDFYFMLDDTPGNQDTSTRRTRSASCDVGDTPLDFDTEISGLAGTPIDTLRTVSVLTGGPQYGESLDLVTTTSIPGDTTRGEFKPHRRPANPLAHAACAVKPTTCQATP